MPHLHCCGFSEQSDWLATKMCCNSCNMSLILYHDICINTMKTSGKVSQSCLPGAINRFGRSAALTHKANNVEDSSACISYILQRRRQATSHWHELPKVAFRLASDLSFGTPSWRHLHDLASSRTKATSTTITITILLLYIPGIYVAWCRFRSRSQPFVYPELLS